MLERAGVIAPDRQPVAVIGGGLAGCLLAVLLGQRGIPVTVYERRQDPRRGGAAGGRSINLAISARGLDALQCAGLREQTLARALPMHGRMVHLLNGSPTFRPYSADGLRAINAVSREELNRSLLDAVTDISQVTVRFSHRLVEFDVATGKMVFDTPSGLTQEHPQVVFCADGANSTARAAMRVSKGLVSSQEIFEYGYKELTIPPRGGDFALDPDALHIWPRGSSMMLALPNLDRSFTCTLVLPLTGDDCFAALDTPEKVEGYFERQYLDVVDMMPTLSEDYLRRPVGSLVTVCSQPWVINNGHFTAVLVGDAAHAMLPFLGQGANCALQDCVEIARCFDEAGGAWKPALAMYERRRRSEADVIAGMSRANFVEMRDRVSSPIFRMVSAAEHAMARMLGGRYVTRYELVSFTTMPYSEIPRRMRRQRLALWAAFACGLAGVSIAAARAGSCTGECAGGRRGIPGPPPPQHPPSVSARGSTGSVMGPSYRTRPRRATKTLGAAPQRPRPRRPTPASGRKAIE